MINQKYLKEKVRYEPITGEFFSVETGVKYKATDKDGYLIIRIKDKNYRAARLAFLYMTGKMPQHTVDHIDQIKNNDSWNNLRDVPMSANKLNMTKPRKGNTTGYLGVSFHKATGTYQAGIKVCGVRKQLGYFPTAELARDAYLKAKNAVLCK